MQSIHFVRNVMFCSFSETNKKTLWFVRYGAADIVIFVYTSHMLMLLFIVSISTLWIVNMIKTLIDMYRVCDNTQIQYKYIPKAKRLDGTYDMFVVAEWWQDYDMFVVAEWWLDYSLNITLSIIIQQVTSNYYSFFPIVETTG